MNKDSRIREKRNTIKSIVSIPLKIVVLAFISISMLVTLTGCDNKPEEPRVIYATDPTPTPTPIPIEEESSGVTQDLTSEEDLDKPIVISPESFDSEIERIQMNPTAYVGRQIEIEGVMRTFVDKNNAVWGLISADPEKQESAKHGHDVALEFYWDGELPEEGALIKIKGEIDYVFHEGAQYLCAMVDDFKVIKENYVNIDEYLEAMGGHGDDEELEQVEE